MDPHSTSDTADAERCDGNPGDEKAVDTERCEPETPDIKAPAGTDRESGSHDAVPPNGKPRGAQPRDAKPGNTLTRRGFLATGGIVATMVALGGIGLATQQAQAAYVRPPGAEDNADLVARCNRCQRCLQVCPYDIITPVPLAQNLIGYGTPLLDFTRGYCDYCMLCVDACPTGALRWGTPTEHNVGVAKVLSDACVAWDWTGCTVCRDECPVEDAITLDDHGRPVVHEDLCDGCGRCEQVCPSSSLRAYDPTVAAKAIIVVSRESGVAAIEGVIDTADAANRLVFKGGSHDQ